MPSKTIVTIIAVILGSCSAQAQGQVFQHQMGPQSLLQLSWWRVSLPQEQTRTCVAISQDHRFQLEKWDNVSASHVDVYEGRLTDESWNQLSAVVNTADFRNLVSLTPPPGRHAVLQESDVVDFTLRRDQADQRIDYISQDRSHLPDSLNTLYRWLKSLDKAKGKRVERGSPQICKPMSEGRPIFP